MKKILAVALSLVMLLAVSVPAFAVDIAKDGGTGEALVKTSTQNEDGEEAAGFTVSIPAENIIPWDSTETDFTYHITSQLAPAKAVSVEVKDADEVNQMTDVNGLTLPYWITNATATMTGPIVTDQACIFTINVDSTDGWDKAPVSEYSDTLLFTASIVDA